MATALDVDIELKVGAFKAHYKFAISSGIFGVYGDSGQGKTTLFNAISGLVTPQNGSIVLNSKTLFSSQGKVDVKIHKRRIGYCFQDYRLFDHLTVLENIMAVKCKEVNHRLLQEIIDITGIGHIAKQKVSLCSGGERQRVAIGRALFMEPELIMLDEPFAALDPGNVRRISDLIQHVAQRYSIPVLVISHQLEDIQLITDDVVMLSSGSVSYCGSLQHYVFENGVAPTILVRYKNLIDLHLYPSESSAFGYAENQLLGLRFVVAASHTHHRKMTAILPATEILISSSKLKGISARNSLRGRVKRMVSYNEKTFCFVDAGVMLIAEITTLSAQELHLEPNSEVYCHFKSVVLEFL